MECLAEVERWPERSDDTKSFFVCNTITISRLVESLAFVMLLGKANQSTTIVSHLSPLAMAEATRSANLRLAVSSEAKFKERFTRGLNFLTDILVILIRPWPPASKQLRELFEPHLSSMFHSLLRDSQTVSTRKIYPFMTQKIGSILYN